MIREQKYKNKQEIIKRDKTTKNAYEETHVLALKPHLRSQ
jgi:hypothetical protein